MEKLNMHTTNIADKNYEVLSKLFPNAVTEAITGYDETGQAIVERTIDADVLRREISCKVVEGGWSVTSLHGRIRRKLSHLQMRLYQAH